MTPRMATPQYIEGMSVFDVNGEKIGTVSEHGVQDNALIVHHGFFHKDIYIPLSAIAENTPSGIVLSATKEVRLHKQNVTEQQVSDTVRKDRVTVEGANEVRGADNQGRTL